MLNNYERTVEDAPDLYGELEPLVWAGWIREDDAYNLTISEAHWILEDQNRISYYKITIQQSLAYFEFIKGGSPRALHCQMQYFLCQLSFEETQEWPESITFKVAILNELIIRRIVTVEEATELAPNKKMKEVISKIKENELKAVRHNFPKWKSILQDKEMLRTLHTVSQNKFIQLFGGAWSNAEEFYRELLLIKSNASQHLVARAEPSELSVQIETTNIRPVTTASNRIRTKLTAAKELDASNNIEDDVLETMKLPSEQETNLEATALVIDTLENSEGPLPNDVQKSPSVALTGAGPLSMFHHGDVSGSDDKLQADLTVSTGSVPHAEDYMRWC